MATIQQWENDLSMFNNDELEEYQKAVATLRTWPRFEREYQELKLFTTMISGEISNRMFKNIKAA